MGLNAAGYWGWTEDPYIGNYGDNALLYFHQYQNAAPGTPLADKAKTGTNILAQGRDPEALLSDFRDDVRRGRLPAVSWIVAPEAYTEHPNWEPDYGAWYVSQVIDILASEPEVWSKMVLFVTYDEDGGFFDHLVPPTPVPGRSTVPTTNEIFPGNADHTAGPYGLGVRVPMIVVSPWTRGGWIDSQLFDHTSMIRFLEARFGRGRPDLIESNITPWRRAVVGDLTSAFNFRTPNNPSPVALPSTDDFKPVDLVRHPDQVPVPPADQHVPPQERGVRPARALPYVLHADGDASGGMLRLSFRNAGSATAVFQARPAGGDQPRTYTVEPGKALTDGWAAGSGYDVSVHGPNGFFRQFRAGQRPPAVTITTAYDAHKITLVFTNTGRDRVRLTVVDAYGSRTVTVLLRAGESTRRTWVLSRTRGWYDLTVTVAGADGAVQRFAGHVESGRDSITDPNMGGLVGG